MTGSSEARPAGPQPEGSDGFRAATWAAQMPAAVEPADDERFAEPGPDGPAPTGWPPLGTAAGASGPDEPHDPSAAVLQGLPPDPRPAAVPAADPAAVADALTGGSDDVPDGAAGPEGQDVPAADPDGTDDEADLRVFVHPVDVARTLPEGDDPVQRDQPDQPDERPDAVDAAAGEPQWWRHDDGRWVVGDPGRQPAIVPKPMWPAPTRPDTVVDGARAGGIDYRAVSLRGLGHRDAGTPRQDAYLVRTTRDGNWLVGCVADGVSEPRLSHEAADLACQEITSRLGGALSERPAEPDDADAPGEAAWHELVLSLPWQNAVDEASRRIVEAAVRHTLAAYERRGETDKAAELASSSLRDGDARKVMATTAVAFVVSTRPDPEGTYPFALTVAAGDSGAFLLSDGAWYALTEVKNDGAEIASSMVSPLPRTTRVVPAVGRLRSGDLLLVATDGVLDALGRGRGAVGGFLARAWATPPEVLSFAEHVSFYRKTFTDDRTAVAVWAGR